MSYAYACGHAQELLSAAWKLPVALAVVHHVPCVVCGWGGFGAGLWVEARCCRMGSVLKFGTHAYWGSLAPSIVVNAL